MIEDMYAVMQRINEIKKRFGLQQRAVLPGAERSFEKETEQRLKETMSQETKQIERKPTAEKYSVGQIKDLVQIYAKKMGVPVSLINAVIEKESGFNQYAVSVKGAKGLMQLMPEVMRQVGVSNPFVPEENIRGGIANLKRLLMKYDWDYKKALAAYNAGENVVDTRGIPPYRETREYIRKVIDAYVQNSE
jgi:soluble lytic murein transglycosylase-like protein